MQINSSSLEQSTRQLLADHPEVVTELGNRLGLLFSFEREQDGNVCLVDSEEVRTEFKVTFTFVDIVNYLFGLFHSPLYQNRRDQDLHIDFPYPENAEAFWRIVESGKRLYESK